MSRYTRDMLGRLTTYFKQKLRVVPHRTGWLRQGTCPGCGKEKKLGINLYLDRTNCFSCGYHPKPILLVMKLEALDTLNEVHNFLDSFESAEYLETSLPMLEEKDVKLPESFTLLEMGTSSLANMARNYMRKRKYDTMKLTLKGVGYCTRGTYKGRIITPFYERGRLVYFNARTYMGIGTKHKNPPVDDFGIGKSQLIYNVDAIHIYKTVYGVESATNALTIGDRAIAFGGKLMSMYQVSKILRSPVKRFIMIWDPDAYWEALHAALAISRHKMVKVIKLPKQYRAKFNPDVNDLGWKTTKKFVDAEPWLTYQDVYKRYIVETKPIYHLPNA